MSRDNRISLLILLVTLLWALIMFPALMREYDDADYGSQMRNTLEELQK